MNPRDFALYDLLNLAAHAVDEAESGRPAKADAAWLEAWMSAEGLFAPHSAADAAIGVILAASAPDRTGQPGRACLWNALDAAAFAALVAMDGQQDLCAVIAPDVFEAAAMLAPFERAALTVILAGIQRMAEAGDEVTT